MFTGTNLHTWHIERHIDMAITCELDIAVGCVLAHLSKMFGLYAYLHNACVSCICKVAPYFVTDKYVYIDMGIDLVHMHTCVHSYIHPHTDLCMCGYMHT